MLKDGLDRKIDYLRISLTDKCSLRCRYCSPASFQECTCSELMGFDEIHRVIRIFESAGITKFRFTGGEPFLRKDILSFFESLKIEKYNITSCLSIKDLDVDRINKLPLKSLNVSIDTLNKEKYSWLTRGGDIDILLDNLNGIKVDSLKFNTVLMDNINETEIMDLIDFADRHNAVLRFIEKMDFIETGLKAVPLTRVIDKLKQDNIIETMPVIAESAVAEYYKTIKSNNKIGFIMPLSKPFCKSCSRLRIKSDGELRACLFSGDGLQLKELLRRGVSNEQLKDIIEKRLQEKIFLPKINSLNKPMSCIGG